MDLFNLVTVLAILWISGVSFLYFMLLCSVDRCRPITFIGDLLITSYATCLTFTLIDDIPINMMYKILIISLVAHFFSRSFFLFINKYNKEHETNQFIR